MENFKETIFIYFHFTYFTKAINNDKTLTIFQCHQCMHIKHHTDKIPVFYCSYADFLEMEKKRDFFFAVLIIINAHNVFFPFD